MSKFVGELITRSLDPSEIKALGEDPTVQIYELTELFRYQSDVLSGYIVECPVKMLTNLASIPKPAQAVLTNDDPRIEKPSVPHDRVYFLKGKMPDGKIITRQQADAMLREAMELQGAGSIVRNAVYWAVRLFGGIHWN